MASSLVLTRSIVCAVACAIAITSRPTTGQTIYMTAPTGNVCRVISERFEYDVTATFYRHHPERAFMFVVSAGLREGDYTSNLVIPGTSLSMYSVVLTFQCMRRCEHMHARGGWKMT